MLFTIHFFRKISSKKVSVQIIYSINVKFTILHGEKKLIPEMEIETEPLRNNRRHLIKSE